METIMIIIRTAIYMPFLILATIFMAIFGTLAYITLFIVHYAGMPVVWVYDNLLNLLKKCEII